jgi:succinate dehydrogenase / fumarate reductase, membrane anchor subunit
MRTRVVPQRGLNFEYIMWMFTRLSAFILIFLAFVGLAAALYMGARTEMDLPTFLRWTFFPNQFHVANSNIPAVFPDWSSAYWNLMEMLIIFFGVSHGCNGLRVVLEDYVGYSAAKPFLRGLVLLLWISLLIVAYSVIIATQVTS